MSAVDGPLRQPQSLVRHATETLVLAAPLAVAQLAQMAMGVTDTVLLGGLGGDALAAGGLGSSLMISVLVVLQGMLSGVSVLVAQALGGGRSREVPALYWTGMLLTVLLVVPSFALFSAAGPLLLAVGEPPALVDQVGAYISVLRWATPGALLGMGMLRAFLPAVGGGKLILWVTLGEVLANGVLCYGLIHGRWGLSAMGLEGAALATVIVLSLGAVVLMALLHGRRAGRQVVAWAWPRTGMLRALVSLGLPVAGSFAVETGLFVAVALLIGLLGPAALAAQQVALSVISVAFMIPLGIAQAANIRVGRCIGALDNAGARRAGLVAIGLGAAFEIAAALVNLLAPATVVGLYLDPALAEPSAIAIGLLGVATVFQVADGVQCVAGGALRGLGDTRVPFALATLGYWGFGFPAAWWLTMHMGFGPAGAWWGLAAGLVVAATLLTRRFMQRAWSARPSQS